jgi:isocitrate dehydrogenase
MIPDRCAGVYTATIDFAKNMALWPNYNGKCSKRRFDGSKAEEYGSHDKTFQIAAEGIVRVVDAKELFWWNKTLRQMTF